MIHAGDSSKIEPGDIPEMKDVRLFSVDGGHTEEIVLHDMRLAENCLADGGLVPFYIGFNKVLFARREIDDAYGNRTMTAVFSSVFGDHDVGVLVPVPKRPKDIARRSETARAIYRRLASLLN